jgi:hypothetical protein
MVRPCLRDAAALAPLLFAIPVLSGVVTSLVNLGETSDPYLGFATTATNVDAEAVFLGLPLYQDPTDGYTGLPLSPLFPALVGGLDHLAIWSGWGIILSVCSAAALAALAGALAYRAAVAAGAARLPLLGGAVGIGAIGWWLVSFVPIDLLYEARADQPAWALALGGLLLVPATLDGSRRAGAGAVLLLAAAAFTKQPAGVAALVAVIWAGLEAAVGAVPWRRAAAFALTLLALGAAVMAVLSLATSGWAFTFIVEIPARETREQGLRASTRELLTSSAGPAAFAAGLWLALWPRRRELPGRPQLRLAGILALFAVVGSATAVVSNTKQGSLSNQFIGVAWALALLGAIAWGHGLGRTRSAALGAGVVAALFGLSQLDSLRATIEDEIDVRVPPARRVSDWVSVPRPLRSLARERSVYHPVYSDLDLASRRRVYPSHVELQDVLAGGERPMFLVRSLLGRRFGVVFRFDEAQRFRDYASAYGKREENFLWKLNRVIEARYRPSDELPVGVRAARALPDGAYLSPGPLVRRPGRERARWMRDCFGPFRVGSETWEIRNGGGFWCRPARAPVLRLRGTPANVSEVRTARSPERFEGRLAVALRRGFFEADCAPEWRLRGTVVQSRVLIELFDGARRVGRVGAPGEPDGIELDISPSKRPTLSGGRRRVAVRLPAGCGWLSLRGSRASDVRFRLDQLRLR